jgi:hypothetical protein
MVCNIRLYKQKLESKFLLHFVMEVHLFNTRSTDVAQNMGTYVTSYVCMCVHIYIGKLFFSVVL